MGLHELHIPGLELLEELGRGTHSVVYRARRSGRDYAVKVPLDPVLDDADIRQRLREAATLALIRHPALPAVVDVGVVNGVPYVAMELARGAPLSRELGTPMTEARTVAVARSLCSVLHELHAQNLVHRDIKPANILIDDNGNAMLVDFGLAAYATMEPARAVGTFIYAAPEQTGMLKRPVDGRADLYALGAVLYECATGRPPFSTNDVSELLRQHAAVVATPVRELNPLISVALSAIIERLLSKDPDDRYQSGAALGHDLDRLDELRARFNAVESVLLRTGELPGPPLPLQLVGRQRELHALRTAWEATVAGQGRVVRVVGPTGSGKSRLMSDFSAQVPLTLSARCVADDPMPYAAMRQVCDGLLSWLIDPPIGDEPLEREVLQQAAEDLGPLLRVVAPRLAATLGAGPTSLSFDEPEGRIEDAMARFLSNLSELLGPLLIRVDDVQWIDHGSRRILERLAERLPGRPLMLLLAGGDGPQVNDTDAASTALLSELAEPIELSRFGEAATAALISDLLGSRRIDPQVSAMVLKLSDGLPLLARELTRALVDDGRLRPHWGHWQLDLDGVDLLELPLGAQRLVERRLRRLSERAHTVLQIAAVGGGPFDEALLAQVGQLEVPEVLLAVAEAQRSQLVERAGDGRFKFVHSRIAEVLLHGLNAQQRGDLHCLYAQALDGRGGQGEEHLFSVARHYALAHGSHHGRRRYETNLQAGLRALSTHAVADARDRLMIARAAAEEAAIAPGLELWEALGEACHRTGRLDDALEHYTMALTHAGDSLSWARIQGRRAAVLTASHALREASEVIGEALTALGENLPRPDVLSAATTAAALGRFALRSTTRPATHEAHERTRLLARLYGALVHIAYAQGEMGLMLQAGLRLGEPARALGDCAEGVRASADHATMLFILGLHPAGRKYAARATAIATQTGDPITIAQAHVAECYGHLFAGDLTRFQQTLLSRLDELRRWLPTAEVLTAHYALTYTYATRGHVQRALSVSEAALGFLERMGTRSAVVARHPLYRLRCAILAMAAQPQAARELLLHVEAAASKLRVDQVDLRATFGPMALLYVESERYDALEALEAQFRTSVGTPPLWQLAERSGYTCVALGRLAVVLRARRTGQPVQLDAFRAAVELADPGRRSQAHRALVLAIRGALAWLEGNLTRAQQLLDEAESMARERDNPLALFEVGRIRAHIFHSQGMTGPARSELVRADALAEMHGMLERARRLRAELPLDDLRRSASSTHLSHIGAATDRNPSNILLRRHLDALLAVALATADPIDSSRQARSVLDHLVRILGAERGFLFLHRRGSDTLELAAGRGGNGQDLDASVSYSRSVVDRVHSTRRPYVHSSGLESLRNASDSVVAGDLRSIIAAPLMLNDEFVGVIYLDNHLAAGVFSEDDLSILAALSAHIAIAVQTQRAADERRQFEARLRQQQKLESIGTLASGVAHEVNNPIQGIMSYAELIRRFGEKPETVREFSGHIIDECRRVATIVKNLLALARSDDDVRTPENLYQIVQGSLSLFRMVLVKDQIRLDVTVPEDLPELRCNGQQVQQVIMNLLTNARDALNERYPTGDADKTIRVSAGLITRDAQPMIRLTVEDHGTGIDPTLTDRIFDPFFTTKPQGQGTGLGLWICHRIVMEQGGHLSFHSAPDDFTRFHVDLPIDSDEVAVA